MEKKNRLNRRVVDWLYDHAACKTALEYAWAILLMTVSAFALALGFKLFLSPYGGSHKMVSGGVSGIAMTIIEVIELFSGRLNTHTNDLVYGGLYFAINVPIFFLAFFGIGKRFAILSMINVAEVSLFTNMLNLPELQPTFEAIGLFCEQQGGMLSRAIFAGVCTGISSGLAFKADASGGGLDVIAYFIALKKNVLVGKYSVALNCVTLVLFTLFASMNYGFGSKDAVQQVGCVPYSLFYMIVVMLVIDLIHVRNKKVKIEIITNNPELGKILIANLPHAATELKGIGAYSGQTRSIFQMVISSFEVKRAVDIIRESDPAAFIQVIDLKQVYGRFFMRPIR